MTIDGGCTREEAENYCDSAPWLFGCREKIEKQEELI
jgi:hypothetical protein